MNTEQLERIIKRNSTHGTFGKMVSMSETDFRALFAGKVLVPVEPTEKMINAGVEAGISASPNPWCPAAYKAMITESQESKK